MPRIMERNAQRVGYRHPSIGQACLVATMALRLPSRQPTGGAIDHLGSLFGVKLPQASAEQGEVSGRLRSHADLLGAIANVLLRACAIPLFGKPALLAASHSGDEGIWHARIALPALDHIPPEVAVRAWLLAAKIVERLAADNECDVDWASLWTDVDRQLLQPLQLLSGGGVSTVPMLQTAFEKQIPFRHLGHGIYQLGWGARSLLLNRSSLPSDSATGLTTAGNKRVCASMLRAAGLPAPRHLPAPNLEAARKAASSLGWPVVVKPEDRDRGEGVTIGIRDDKALVEAYAYARKASSNILVEGEVAGVCHRLMVAGGRFLYAVRRLPPHVEGDGHSSIKSLVERLSRERRLAPPWMQKPEVGLDAATRNELSRQGLRPSDIPELGRKVALRGFEAPIWGGETVDVTEQVHPDNIFLAEATARLLGLHNAGIDLISTDIGVAWHANEAVVNEVNFAPHFGGTMAARQRMGDFMEGLFDTDGRIPIEVFVGGEAALQHAMTRHASLAGSTRGCFLTSHATTLGGDGCAHSLDKSGIFDRASALLLDRRLEHLLLVVQTDELLQTGLPFDRITRLEVHAQETLSGFQGDATDQAALRGSMEQVRALLARFLERA